MTRQPRTHVAILREPYLELVLKGLKTVEARLTKRRIPPFDVTAPGDCVFLKESGAAYAGRAIVSAVAQYELAGPEDVCSIREKYEDRVLGRDLFWLERLNARYATLVTLDEVTLCRGGPDLSHLSKRDRRFAWHTLDTSHLAVPDTLCA